MVPIDRKDGRWVVFVPRKLSQSGKRTPKYFATKSQALKFISEFKSERLEHGKQSVTSEERSLIAWVRSELGDLKILPEVVRHWKRTSSESIAPIMATDAANQFIEFKLKTIRNKRTISDLKSRLGKFGEWFHGRHMHEIHSGELETFIMNANKDWTRRSIYKRIRPLFEHAVRHRWVAVNPIPALDRPKPKRARKEVYTKEEFQNLLMGCIAQDNELLAFVALAGFAMLRTSEMIRLYKDEDVLRWEDIQWDRDRIHQGISRQGNSPCCRQRKIRSDNSSLTGALRFSGS